MGESNEKDLWGVYIEMGRVKVKRERQEGN